MNDLVELLKGIPLGRVFLANLHHGLSQSPAHIELASFRDLWLLASSRLGPGATASAAREQLFELFHAPHNRKLRFRRPPPPVLGPTFLVHTTVTPYDLVENPAKGVVHKRRLEARLPRKGKDPRVWSTDECELLCELLRNPAYRNGRDFAHRYDIFWATPNDGALGMSADLLRDRQGLVHIAKDEPVIQLTFRCEKDSPEAFAAPTAIEAAYHRRFKARCVGAACVDPATAADLSELRRSRTLADGAAELTLSSIPIVQLESAKFVGLTTEYPDISGISPTPSSDQSDDAFFADVLVGPDLDRITNELSLWLQAGAPAGTSKP